MANPERPTPSTTAEPVNKPDSVDHYVQEALRTWDHTKHPVQLFEDESTSSSQAAPTTNSPLLQKDIPNQVLLYPGSYNPSHQGHFATILYFYERRVKLNVTAMVVFADPSEIIAASKKQYGDVILPQDFRNKLFTSVPELSRLVADKWLYLLMGGMEGHALFLKEATRLMSTAGFPTKLVGFLGGDNLSVHVPRHFPAVELPIWGPIDEFIIINARRPVDFYDPKEGVPLNLPGCTEWARAGGSEEVALKGPEVGELWTCTASVVPGAPVIQFRASSKSHSTGISSTKIRKIMNEAPPEELYDQLKDKVLGVELLVEWLKNYRENKK